MLHPKITSLRAISGYKLHLRFETGEEKVFDVSPYIHGPWFGALRDKEYFKTVRLLPDGSGIAWADGQDVAPHELYEASASL